MELTELSLAPALFVSVESNMNLYSESENKASKKRKLFPSSDHDLLGPPRLLQASVDLHVKNPLPLDWEQCLDLESGRKYYMNRKTQRKTWNWPKDQVIDLELNISSSNCITTQTDHHHDQIKSFKPSNHIQDRDSNNGGYDQDPKNSSSSNNMVALACLNCHLLVILSRTCPACPNCKYVHSLPTPQTSHLHLPQHRKVSSDHAKSLNTLSLLN